MKHLLKHLVLLMVLAIQSLNAARIYNLITPEQMNQFQWIKARGVLSNRNHGARLKYRDKNVYTQCNPGGLDIRLADEAQFIEDCGLDDKGVMHWDLIWRWKDHQGESHWRSFRDTNKYDVYVKLHPNPKKNGMLEPELFDAKGNHVHWRKGMK